MHKPSKPDQPVSLFSSYEEIKPDSSLFSTISYLLLFSLVALVLYALVRRLLSGRPDDFKKVTINKQFYADSLHRSNSNDDFEKL